jgi:hypothetical protein
MKRFLTLLACSLLTLAAFSQTPIYRNTSELIVRKLTTTNATATQIDLVTLGTNEIGTITVKVIGFNAVGVAAITGTKSYRYSKVAGTLTLGTEILNPADSLVVDTGVSGATFAASAVSNNISVKVTGKASTTIYWKVITKQSGIVKD